VSRKDSAPRWAMEPPPALALGLLRPLALGKAPVKVTAQVKASDPLPRSLRTRVTSTTPPVQRASRLSFMR